MPKLGYIQWASGPPAARLDCRWPVWETRGLNPTVQVETLSGGYFLRRSDHRLRPRRLRDRHPRGAARLQDRHRRARLSRRHLSELGLHPDQGAAALGRDLSLHAARQGLWAESRQYRLRPEGRGRALARRLQAAQRRRRLPDEEEQSVDHLGRGRDRRARQGDGEGLQERSAERRARRRRLSGQAHHHRYRRAAARAARPRARQETGLDLFRGDGAADEFRSRCW